jgi:hypothetical protein
MSNKPRRQFTLEQKAEAVQIVAHSGKPISQIEGDGPEVRAPCASGSSKPRLTRQKHPMAP